MPLFLPKRNTLLLITLLLFSRSVFALNFAVDNTGAGLFCTDHSGSGGNFTTLAAAQAAANVAGGPHTIDVCPGIGAYTAQGGAMAAANYNGLIIQGTTGTAANVTVNPTGGNEIFDIQQPNFTIQHLTAISGNGNDGIQLTNSNNTSILNVDIQNTGRNGILISNSTGVTISNVTITTTGREGILANAASTGVTINSADGTKPATVISGTTRECIEIDSANANLDDITVTNCNNMAIRMDGANATLDNIVVSNSNNIGIYLNGLAPLLNQDNPANTISINNTAREGIRSTNNADNMVIDNVTVNTTGANFECAEHQGDGDGITVNFQNYDLSNCGREGLWMRSPNQVADNITVNTNGGGRECMEVDGADSIVTNLDLDNCSGIGLRIDGARTSATTIDINTTGNVGLRFDGADVVVNTADITNSNGIGLLVSGNNGIVNGVNISNVNNTGMRIESSGADVDNIDITDTRIHGLQITNNSSNINTLTLTNIGTYLGGNAGADGITTTNRTMTLTNVTINDAPDYGIHFNTTANNHNGAKSFTNITVKDTGDDGIFINRSNNNLTMDNINISNSTQDGLRFDLSRRATVTNLNSSNNTLDGVVIFRSRQIDISDSTIDGNQDGIVINRSRQNEIFDSTISNNTNRGIMLLTQNNNTTDEARNNIIRDNIISGNTNFGLRIFNNGTADNDANQIYENCFNNPSGINARDDETIGAPAANTFDVGGRGNFWDDDSANSPGFSETCVNVVAPIGICDNPFPIPTVPNSNDNNPLASCSLIPPVVDHYLISYAATPGVTCEATTVTITARDISDTPVNVPAGTVLTINSVEQGTATLAGSWDDLALGGGLLGAAGNPITYTWPVVEESTFTLNLTQTTPLTIDIDLLDDAAVPNSEKGDGDNSDPADDPIEFRDSVFRFFAGGSVDTIGTQIAGKESDQAPDQQTLEIRSVETDPSTGVCGTRVSGPQTIQMAFKCSNPTTCHASAPRVEINNTENITPGNDNADTVDDTNGNFSDVDLTFNASGQAPFTFDYLDAGQIQLFARLTIPASGVEPEYTLFGASNTFVVRPFGFDVQVTGNPAATGSGGARFTEAGEDFTVTARAVAWDASGDSNNDGVPDNHDDTDPSNNIDLSSTVTFPTTPNYGQEGTNEATDEDIDLSALLNQPNPGNDPGLSGGTSITSITSGSGSSSTVNYDEVGIIEITAQVAVDNDYLGGGSVIGKTGYVGRFVPYVFEATLNTPEFTSACSTFSYIGQSFTYATVPVINLTARAKGIAPAFGTATQNYTGGFFKLTDAKLQADGNRTYSAAVGTLDLGNVLVPVPLAADPVIADTGSGTATLTFNDGGGITFDRAAPEVPFDADIALSINVLDEDDAFAGDGNGVTQNPVSFGTASAGNGIGFDNGKEQRWGRMVLTNAFGSELLSIEVPLSVEYYNTDGFEINTADTCTTYDSADMSFSNADGVTLGNLTLTGSGTVVNGRDDPANSILATSTANEIGSADVTIDLMSQDWLQFDWDSDTNYDNDPTARITWGIFSGPDEFIYIREPW